jgi:hypothetical protein
MSALLEKWSVQLGKDAAEEALRRHPEIAEMSWQEQEILLQGLERLHESMCVPVTVENSERLYGIISKKHNRASLPHSRPKARKWKPIFSRMPPPTN